MLQCVDVDKSFGNEVVLKKINLLVNPGERWGLVGVNGSGKTTLLRIIAGEDSADHGKAVFGEKKTRLGYLPQGFKFQPAETVSGFLSRMVGDINLLSNALGEAAIAIANGDTHPDIQANYDRLLDDLQRASENTGRVPQMMKALGLAHIPADMPAENLSGGQKTRLGLAGILLSDPYLLLLDEPTNHLDIEMLEWLENWLRDFRHSALIVSHDRAFLDHVATGIFELDSITHTIKAYSGNYSDYLEARIAEKQKYMQQYQDQQVEIQKLQASAQHVRSLGKFKKGGKADTGDKFARGFFANRSLETMRRAKQLEQRLSRLLNEDHLDRPKPTWEMKIDFDNIPTSGRDVLSFEHLSVGYGQNVLLKDISLNIRLGQRIALVGPNGCGKTTLLRTIAGKIPPLDGSLRLGSGVNLGYMSQEQEELLTGSNALETILSIIPSSQTEARAFLSRYLFTGDDVFIPLPQLSYGERSRLALACLVARGCNFLLLDEPINHLDIPSRTRFEQALAEFSGTILAVVHDRYFIESFADVLWEVKDHQIIVHY